MKKQIPLSKYSKKIQDGIIKLVPQAVAIIEEQENMSKPKVTLEMIYKEFTEFRDYQMKFNKMILNEIHGIKKEMHEFKEETNQKFDLLFSLPTIKKELKELGNA